MQYLRPKLQNEVTAFAQAIRKRATCGTKRDNISSIINVVAYWCGNTETHPWARL